MNGVDLYLVEPAVQAPRATVLFLHWVASKGGDRRQFLREAIRLASLGVVSALPQGTFPWSSDPESSAADLGRIAAEVGRLGGVADHLRAGPRAALPFAIVGHDFGGMYAALLAGQLKPRGLVMVSATPRWADWFLVFWPIREDRFDYQRALSPFDPISHVPSLGDTPVLFQFSRKDFFIAKMTAHEFHEAAPEGAEVRFYLGDHALDLAQVRLDREAFLREALGLAGSATAPD